MHARDRFGYPRLSTLFMFAVILVVLATCGDEIADYLMHRA
jgi:hypothetical protein